MEFILIRHLPTKWNNEQKLQGKKDRKIASLSEEDEIIIRGNKEILKKLSPPDIVLTSTLQRTKQTAEIYGYKAKEEPLLDEIDFGKFEGKTREEFLEEVGLQWFTNPKRTVLGKQIEDLEERIQDFIEKYKQYDCVLIFGHGAWMRAFISYIKNGHVIAMNLLSVKTNELVHLVYQEKEEEDEKPENSRE